jgi:hypothetical protein
MQVRQCVIVRDLTRKNSSPNRSQLQTTCRVLLGRAVVFKLGKHHKNSTAELFGLLLLFSPLGSILSSLSLFLLHRLLLVFFTLLASLILLLLQLFLLHSKATSMINSHE